MQDLNEREKYVLDCYRRDVNSARDDMVDAVESTKKHINDRFEAFEKKQDEINRRILQAIRGEEPNNITSKLSHFFGTSFQTTRLMMASTIAAVFASSLTACGIFVAR